MNALLYKDIQKNINSNDPVLSNMRLVVHLAKKYQGMGIPLDDLIHEGIIGLCKARDKFNPTLEAKFSSYASLWIKATIRQALNDKSRIIRVPAHKTHIADAAPKVSQLDSTYQGTCDSEIESMHNDSHMQHKISNLIGKLKPRQQEIVKMKFGIGCNEMKTIEIAKQVGISVQSVNGTIRNSLLIMKK